MTNDVHHQQRQTLAAESGDRQLLLLVMAELKRAAQEYAAAALEAHHPEVRRFFQGLVERTCQHHDALLRSMIELGVIARPQPARQEDVRQCIFQRQQEGNELHAYVHHQLRYGAGHDPSAVWGTMWGTMLNTMPLAYGASTGQTARYTEQSGQGSCTGQSGQIQQYQQPQRFQQPAYPMHHRDDPPASMQSAQRVQSMVNTYGQYSQVHRPTAAEPSGDPSKERRRTESLYDEAADDDRTELQAHQPGTFGFNQEFGHPEGSSSDRAASTASTATTGSSSYSSKEEEAAERP